MWPPQFWQQQAFDSGHVGTLPFPNSQMPNPAWVPNQTGSGQNQAHMLWNPFVGMMTPTYGCQTAPIFGGPTHTPSSRPNLQTSNSHPDQPMNLESEAEHSVQEINSHPDQPINLDSGSPGSSGKRPLGWDSSKSERKKAMTSSSQSNEYLSKLLDLTNERIRQSNERLEKKEARHEFYKDLELKKLELRNKELSLKERELKLQKEKDARVELDKLLATNWDEIPEDVKPYLVKRRKDLVEYLMNN